MKNRTRQHVTYKNDNFGFFLFLELSPLTMFEFDFLSLLCNTNTLRNILMLDTNVEQDEMMCCVQKMTTVAGSGGGGGGGDIFLFFSFFFFKKPFLVSLIL